MAYKLSIFCANDDKTWSKFKQFKIKAPMIVHLDMIPFKDLSIEIIKIPSSKKNKKRNKK